MNRPALGATIAAVASAAVLAATLSAQRTSTQSAIDTTARIVASAQAVLSALDNGNRTKAQFPFDSPQRTQWSNLPSPMFQRNGARMGDLTSMQRTAVMNLLAVALSKQGLQKVVDTM